MKFLKYLLAATLFIGHFFPTLAGAQTSAASDTNAPAPERFLFVVETSAVMAKRSENAQKVVASIVANGLKGQIATRNTIGIWTFNQQLFTGKLPVQTWTPDTRQIAAVTFAQFIQKQEFEKSPDLSVAWPAVTNIVAKSDHLTLLLVTSGSNPVVGTPYDTAIAESFRTNAAPQRKSNMPFLTILRAVKGQFVAFSVTTPPGPLEVPEYPDGMKPVVLIEAPSPVIPTSAPPLVIRHENLIVIGSPSAKPSPETSAPVVVSNMVAPHTEPTNVVVVATNIAPASAPVVAPAVKPTPATMPVPETRRSLASLLLIGTGAALGLLVVSVALLRRSRRATGESLITRSLHQKDR